MVEEEDDDADVRDGCDVENDRADRLIIFDVVLCALFALRMARDHMLLTAIETKGTRRHTINRQPMSTGGRREEDGRGGGEEKWVAAKV